MREVTDRNEGQERGDEDWDSRDRADLISAIAHPLRRRILRLLHDHEDPHSASKMARELEEPVGSAAYHVRVLHNVAALEETGEKQVRGAVERFYLSTVEDDPPIETLLEETREADEEAG
jgi:DNA-binding transcriptional ArsR family regulator